VYICLYRCIHWLWVQCRSEGVLVDNLCIAVLKLLTYLGRPTMRSQSTSLWSEQTVSMTLGGPISWEKSAVIATSVTAEASDLSIRYDAVASRPCQPVVHCVHLSTATQIRTCRPDFEEPTLNKSNPAHYRPVTNLCTFSKVLVVDCSTYRL